MGEWRFGSQYWSLHGGTTPTRVHMVYQPPSMRLVVDTMVWGANYEYIEEPRLLIWPTTLDERRIDYPWSMVRVINPTWRRWLRDWSVGHCPA
jgi:hypothetical protein